MSNSAHETVLCRYHYDPLDRLADCALSTQADIQRFYCKSRLATEIQGAVQTSVFQHDDQLLAQQQRQGEQVDTTLLATDQQRSVLNALDATQTHPIAYTPYGHRPPENGLLSLLGFNGERPDPVTGHYHLGNGYRQFNPVLMRFNSPDSWSPFVEGGLNAYGYCAGDPRNRMDETGHFWRGISKLFGRMFGTVPKKMPKTANPVSAVVSSPAASIGNTSLDLAPGFDLNSLSQAERNLNYNSPHIKPLQQALLGRHSIDNNADLVERLQRLKGQSSPPPSPPRPRPSNNNLASSAFSDTVEHTSTMELISMQSDISKWTPTTGTDQTSMLNAINTELYIRNWNTHNTPPISNKDIRWA